MEQSSVGHPNLCIIVLGNIKIYDVISQEPKLNDHNIKINIHDLIYLSMIVYKCRINIYVSCRVELRILTIIS